jgi:hypothetical protein
MPETNAECMLPVLETWSAQAGGKGLQTQSAASGEMPAEMPRSRLDLGHRSGQSMKAGALFMQAALYSALARAPAQAPSQRAQLATVC